MEIPIRRKWSNKLACVDAMLAAKNLRGSRMIVLGILKDPEHKEMLTEPEIEFLKMAVALQEIADIMTMDDFSDMENYDDE